MNRTLAPRTFSLPFNILERLLLRNPAAWLYWRDRTSPEEWLVALAGEQFASGAAARAALSALRQFSDVPLRCFAAMPFDRTEWNRRAIWRLPAVTLRRAPDGVQAYVLDDSTCDSLLHAADETEKSYSPKPYNGASIQMPDVVSLVPTYAQWRTQIASAKKQMAERNIKKIVLSRIEQWRMPFQITAPDLLSRLQNQRQMEYAFYFPLAGGVLVGRSPERLLRISGNRIEMDALAGTRPCGCDTAEEQRFADKLLASKKEREEHAIVVEWLCERLHAIATDITAPTMPVIRRTANVQHLYTPIMATLRNEHTIDEILHWLHPTPAVGGAPQEAALALLREIEIHSRGWYAGPIGWISADEAEFAVAIRSAFIERDIATFYTGAGILPQSHPVSEWHETVDKLTPMWNTIFGAPG